MRPIWEAQSTGQASQQDGKVRKRRMTSKFLIYAPGGVKNGGSAGWGTRGGMKTSVSIMLNLKDEPSV